MSQHLQESIQTPRGAAGLLGGAALLFLVLNMVIVPRYHALRVETEILKPAPLPLIVRAPGTLEPEKSETLKSQLMGPVEKKNVKEGSVVRKGDILIVLGRDRIRLDYQKNADNLRNSEADLNRARRELKLQKSLYTKQAVAYSAVEDAERGLVRAEQNVRAARESFRLEELRWNSNVITAPFDGTIIKDYVGDERFVLAEKDLLIVADITSYSLRARVDELDIKRIREGLVGDVKLQIYPQNKLMAKVTSIGSQVDGPMGSHIPVVLKLLDSQGLELRPRLTAEVNILTGMTEPVLSVPLTAVTNTDGEAKVWIVPASGRLRAVPIQTGRTNPDRIEVIGMKAGQRICSIAEPDFVEGKKVLLGAGGAQLKSRKTQALLPPAEETKPPLPGRPGARRPQR
jgi:HlyD family secretion protein